MIGPFQQIFSSILDFRRIDLYYKILLLKLVTFEFYIKKTVSFWILALDLTSSTFIPFSHLLSLFQLFHLSIKKFLAMDGAGCEVI